MFPIAFLLFASSVSAHCSRFYTVKAGDWCDTISAAHQSSTYQLAYSNQGTINECCSNLQVGQSICLALKTGPDCTTTHVVTPTDTCDTLATQFNTNTTMIMGNNPQIGSSCAIYPGQVLCVAPTIQASPIPAGSKWVAPHACQDDSASSVYTPAAAIAPSLPVTSTGSNDTPVTGGAITTPETTPDAPLTAVANAATIPDDTTTDTATTDDTGSGSDSIESVPAQAKVVKPATVAATSVDTTTGDDGNDEDCEDDDSGDSTNTAPVVLNPESGSGDDSGDDEDCDDDDDSQSATGAAAASGDDTAAGDDDEDCDDDDSSDAGSDDGSSDGGDDDEDCDDDDNSQDGATATGGDDSGDDEDCDDEDQ